MRTSRGGAPALPPPPASTARVCTARKAAWGSVGPRAWPAPTLPHSHRGIAQCARSSSCPAFLAPLVCLERLTSHPAWWPPCMPNPIPAFQRDLALAAPRARHLLALAAPRARLALTCTRCPLVLQATPSCCASTASASAATPSATSPSARRFSRSRPSGPSAKRRRGRPLLGTHSLRPIEPTRDLFSGGAGGACSRLLICLPPGPHCLCPYPSPTLCPATCLNRLSLCVCAACEAHVGGPCPDPTPT